MINEVEGGIWKRLLKIERLAVNQLASQFFG